MKTNIKWLRAWAVALGCAVSLPAIGNEPEGSYQDESVFRPALVQQSAPATTPSAPTSRWDAQEPVQTPEEDPGAAGSIPPGACMTCAPTPDFGLQLIAGIEATFFWPQLSREFLETGFTNGLGDIVIRDTTSFGSVGLVGRYWNAGAAANSFTPVVPGTAVTGILSFDQFTAYTADLEVQRRFCWRHWDSFGFVGVRYAAANNDRSLVIQNSFGTNERIDAWAYTGQQFYGTGITFGVFGLRPLFCDDGALKVYFKNRWSILSGNGVAAAQTHASAQNAISYFQSTDNGLAKGDGTMLIVELASGLYWDTCLRCLPGRAFLTAGVEWQYWDTNAGVGGEVFSFADTGTSPASAAFAQVGDMLFDLVGFTFGAGITY
jgi:hypothetical protein